MTGMGLSSGFAAGVRAGAADRCTAESRGGRNGPDRAQGRTRNRAGDHSRGSAGTGLGYEHLGRRQRGIKRRLHLRDLAAWSRRLGRGERDQGRAPRPPAHLSRGRRRLPALMTHAWQQRSRARRSWHASVRRLPRLSRLSAVGSRRRAHVRRQTARAAVPALACRPVRHGARAGAAPVAHPPPKPLGCTPDPVTPTGFPSRLALLATAQHTPVIGCCRPLRPLLTILWHPSRSPQAEDHKPHDQQRCRQCRRDDKEVDQQQRIGDGVIHGRTGPDPRPAPA